MSVFVGGFLRNESVRVGRRYVAGNYSGFVGFLLPGLLGV